MKKNLLLFSGSLILGFLIAESVFRYKGDYQTYLERTGAGNYTSPFQEHNRGWAHTYQPHYEQYLAREEFTDSWTANEDGLKDVNIADVKTGKRIFVLGDSFTEGVGAPPDSSHPRILETLFRLHGDSSLQVINGGLGGSDVFFAYQLMKKYFSKYEPDMVILTINSSDIADCLARGGFERFRRDDVVQYRKPPWFEPIYARSMFARMIAHEIFEYDYLFIRKKDLPQKYEEAFHLIKLAIDSFKVFSKNKQLQFAIVIHPFCSEFQYPETYLLASLSGYIRNSGIPYLDVFHCMNMHSMDSANCHQYYWEKDGHYNSRGYEIMARCVFEFIQKENRVENTFHTPHPPQADSLFD